MGESIFQWGVSGCLQSTRSISVGCAAIKAFSRWSLNSLCRGGARESGNNRAAEVTELKIKKVSELRKGGEMQDKCCYSA